MSRNLRRSGEGRAGCAIWLLLLAVFVMIAWKAVPTKIKSAEFEDYLTELAQFAAQVPGEEIRRRILKRAKEMDIPLDPKKLKVEKSENRIRIECSYTIVLEFPFYSYEWNFEHEVDRPIFIV